MLSGKYICLASDCKSYISSHYIHFLQNFLFKSPKEDSHLKATDFGLSDFIRPGDLMLSDIFSQQSYFPISFRDQSTYSLVIFPVGFCFKHTLTAIHRAAVILGYTHIYIYLFKNVFFTCFS